MPNSRTGLETDSCKRFGAIRSGSQRNNMTVDGGGGQGDIIMEWSNQVINVHKYRETVRENSIASYAAFCRCLYITEMITLYPITSVPPTDLLLSRRPRTQTS